MESGTGESRNRLHGGRLLRRSMTTRTSRLGRVGYSFAAMFVIVIVGVVIIAPVPRPLLRIGMAQLRMR